MITQIDFFILNAIQGIRNPFLDFVMPIITFLGSGGIIWITAAIILIIFRKSRKVGISVIVSLVIGLILSTLLLKNIVCRARPFNTPGALLNVSNILIGAPSGVFSFPSGHAVSSFSAATAMFMYDKKIGTVAFALAGLISFSRLYLYVHFPSDIIAGMIFGALFAFAAVFIVNKIWEKINEAKLSNNTK